jgi:chromosome segregation ATPase
MESIETLRSIIVDSLRSSHFVSRRYGPSAPVHAYTLPESDFDRVEEHLDKLTDEYKQMNEEIEQLKDKNKELTREMNNTNVDNTNTKMKVFRLRRDKTSLETDVKKVEKKNEELKKNVRRMKDNHKLMNDEKEYWYQQYINRQIENSQMQEKISTRDSKITTLIVEKDNAKQENDRLKKKSQS